MATRGSSFVVFILSLCSFDRFVCTSHRGVAGHLAHIIIPLRTLFQAGVVRRSGKQVEVWYLGLSGMLEDLCGGTIHFRLGRLDGTRAPGVPLVNLAPAGPAVQRLSGRRTTNFSILASGTPPLLRMTTTCTGLWGNGRRHWRCGLSVPAVRLAARRIGRLWLQTVAEFAKWSAACGVEETPASDAPVLFRSSLTR